MAMQPKQPSCHNKSSHTSATHRAFEHQQKQRRHIHFMEILMPAANRPLILSALRLFACSNSASQHRPLNNHQHGLVFVQVLPYNHPSPPALPFPGFRIRILDPDSFFHNNLGYDNTHSCFYFFFLVNYKFLHTFVPSKKKDPICPLNREKKKIRPSRKYHIFH